MVDLSDNEYQEIPWNKLYVYLIGPYITRINVKKEILDLKAFTTIDPVTRWIKKRNMKTNDQYQLWSYLKLRG